jgi:hypothetical protein
MAKALAEQETAGQHRQAGRAENRRIRYLRFLVDLALMKIRAGRYTKPEAGKIVENIRSQALQLFPDKELAFELIYRPRFPRTIADTRQLH